MRRRVLVAVVVVGVIGCSATSGWRLSTRPRARTSAERRRRELARVHRTWSSPVRGWPSQLASDPTGVVAVSGGRFVSSFDPRDGSRRWEAEVSGWLSPFIEPAIDSRSVLVSAGDRFVALDRADGTIRWDVPAGEAGPGTARGVALVPSPPSEVVAVTAASDGRLTGRDTADGAPRWTITRAGALEAHLATDPDTGLVVAVWQTATTAMVRAVDAVSGAVHWEQPVEPMVASPLVAGDAVIVAAGDGDSRAHVRALGLADGQVRWSTPVPSSFEPDLVPGADVDEESQTGEIGVQDHLGTVSLLDLHRGVLRWRTDTRVPAVGGKLVLTPAAVVIRNEGRQLVILDRARGRIRSRRTDPVGLPEGIAGLGRRVLVAWRRTEPGRIDALEIQIPSGP